MDQSGGAAAGSWMFASSTGPKVSCRGHDETTGRGPPQSNGVGSGEGRQLAGPLPMGIPPTTRPAKDKAALREAI